MLNNKDIEILMESLSNKPLELLHLDLDENFLDDKGVSILCKKIEEFGELQDLFLTLKGNFYDNFFLDFTKVPKLEKLRLFLNNIYENNIMNENLLPLANQKIDRIVILFEAFKMVSFLRKIIKSNFLNFNFQLFQL